MENFQILTMVKQEKNPTELLAAAYCIAPLLWIKWVGNSVVQRLAWNIAAVSLREGWQDFRAWRMEIRSVIGKGRFLPGGVIGVFCVPLITSPTQSQRFHDYFFPSSIYMDLWGHFSLISWNNLSVNKYTDACDSWLEINKMWHKSIFVPFISFVSLVMLCYNSAGRTKAFCGTAQLSADMD